MNNTMIPKETIHNYSFLKEDVLKTEESKKLRTKMLERATILGNAYKGKVKIFFKTFDSMTKTVETTVWSCADGFITLKGGEFLPVRAIEKVVFD
jgi:hypothetical protein